MYSNNSLVSTSEISLTQDFLLPKKLAIERPQIKLNVHNGQNLIYDSRIKIDCDTTASHRDAESYSIEWTRIGHKMPTRSYVFGNSLIINRFEPNDLGEYSCIVSNRAGQSIRSVKFFEDEYGALSFSLDHEQDLEPSRPQTTTALKLSAQPALDRRFKILLGSLEFNMGDTFAVECLSLCNL